jgi:hypothetical protein
LTWAFNDEGNAVFAGAAVAGFGFDALDFSGLEHFGGSLCAGFGVFSGL